MFYKPSPITLGVIVYGSSGGSRTHVILDYETSEIPNHYPAMVYEVGLEPT